MTKTFNPVRLWHEIPLRGSYPFLSRAIGSREQEMIRVCGPASMCGVFGSQALLIQGSVSSAVALCFAAALASGLTTSAHAGDAGGEMPVKAPAAPAPFYDWTGFYVGGHVANSVGRANSTLSDPEPTASTNPFNSHYGGLQAGYNYVLPSRLLLGIETDITFPSFLRMAGFSPAGRPRAPP